MIDTLLKEYVLGFSKKWGQNDWLSVADRIETTRIAEVRTEASKS